MLYMCEVIETSIEQIRDAMATYFSMTAENREYRDNEYYIVLQARINEACYRLSKRRLLDNVVRVKHRIVRDLLIWQSVDAA